MSPEVILWIVVFAIAISAHESAHAYVAYRCGDSTAKRQGRISMNPIDHIDPIWTILVPGLFILAGQPPLGAAKPVPVNPNRLRNPTRDRAFVAGAGPGANILVAVCCMVLTLFLAPFLHEGGLPAGEGLGKLLMYGVIINSLLAVFNLIPMPPLDGSGILQYFLSRQQARWLQENQTFLGLIFLLLWMTGILSRLLQPFLAATITIHYTLLKLLWGDGIAQALMGLMRF
jgi:Zn-dependent protease